MIDRSKDFIKFACFTRDQLLCSDNPFTMLRVRPRDQTFQEYVLPAAKLCVIPFIEILSIPARVSLTLQQHADMLHSHVGSQSFILRAYLVNVGNILGGHVRYHTLQEASG